MPARNDYRCTNCNVILEFYGAPSKPCGNCNAMAWEWVPSAENGRHTIITHAASVDHILRENAATENDRIDEIAADADFNDLLREAEEVSHIDPADNSRDGSVA